MYPKFPVSISPSFPLLPLLSFFSLSFFYSYVNSIQIQLLSIYSGPRASDAPLFMNRPVTTPNTTSFLISSIIISLNSCHIRTPPDFSSLEWLLGFLAHEPPYHKVSLSTRLSLSLFSTHTWYFLRCLVKDAWARKPQLDALDWVGCSCEVCCSTVFHKAKALDIILPLPSTKTLAYRRHL